MMIYNTLEGQLKAAGLRIFQSLILIRTKGGIQSCCYRCMAIGFTAMATIPLHWLTGPRGRAKETEQRHQFMEREANVYADLQACRLVTGEGLLL